MKKPTSVEILEPFKEEIHNYYYVDKMTQNQIGEKYNVKQSAISYFFKKNKWKIDGHNGSHYLRGVTKDNPVLKAIIEKGRQTQILNGKSKGKNNPMYGKVTHAKCMFRTDLGHCARSSWEATFARLLKYLNIPYEYEPMTFVIGEGITYTPDFYIPSKNRFYEIKGYMRDNKFEIFKQKYPHIKISLIDEKKYYRIVSKFAKALGGIEDSNYILNSDILEKMFKEFCYHYNVFSVTKFIRSHGISYKTINKICGGQMALRNVCKNDVKDHFYNVLKSHANLFLLQENRYPTYNELVKIFPYSHIILFEFFGKIEDFIEILESEKSLA